MEQVILITAGGGPKECQWVVGRLASVLKAEALAANGTARIVRDEGREGEPAKSLILICAGLEAPIATGTVQWIGTSTYRPRHKRRNWYVRLTELDRLEETAGLGKREVRFQAMKASGPGGQHVNATQSAVRAEHLPSGIVVVARGERSQHANKKLALLKLRAALHERELSRLGEAKTERWRQHRALERDRPVRIYQGPNFRLRS